MSSASTNNPSGSRAPSNAGSSSILVHKNQTGNPLLQHFHGVRWEFSEIVPDYVVGRGAAALFLSLKYHNLNPEYIHERIKQVGKTYNLRILLVLIDVADPHHALKEIGKLAMNFDYTLMPAWSSSEAGGILERYKMSENTTAESIRPALDQTHDGRMTDCLTSILSVNKTDAATMMTHFRSLQEAIDLDEEKLALLPGLSSLKARHIHDAFHRPFLKSREKQ